jgi:acyl-CoA thioester hydrolase
MNTKIHYYSKTILEPHLDVFGHVNNAVYLEILEEARWDMITQNGYGLEQVMETGLGPVLLEVHLKFKKELRLRQTISIETTVGSFDKVVCVIHQEIKNEKGEICCIADFRSALFDLKRRKLVPPSQEWLKAIGH